MKTLKRIPMVAIAVGVALLAGVLFQTTTQPTADSAPQAPPQILRLGAHSASSPEVSPEFRAGSQRKDDRLNVIPEHDPGTFATVTVPVGKTLATVNGVRLTLKDLVPIGQNDHDEAKTLPKSSFDFLLRRAIEREVTMLAARKEGIQLTADQEQRLNRVVQGFQIPETGQFYSSSDDANVRFTARDLTALMLQESLLAKCGVGSAVTEADVVRYYNDHRDEFVRLSADGIERVNAWREIGRQIRQQLAPGVREKYQSALDDFLRRTAEHFQVATEIF